MLNLFLFPSQGLIDLKPGGPKEKDDLWTRFVSSLESFSSRKKEEILNVEVFSRSRICTLEFQIDDKFGIKVFRISFGETNFFAISNFKNLNSFPILCTEFVRK